MLHTHFPRNSKVLVILTDGRQFVDRVLEGKSRYWILKTRGKFPRDGVRSITVYRG